MATGRGDYPLVVVLMATHDGEQWLDAQVRSIFDQVGVNVRLVVSDDASGDATPGMLDELRNDDRVTVLPSAAFGSPQANFARLVRDADVSGATAVAFADQDDIWHRDKLARQLHQLDTYELECASSNVTAFWEQPNGARRTSLINKAQAQTSLDFLLEAAGPGCTYVFRAEAFARIRDHVVALPPSWLVPHDWLLYATARALGMRWRIDAKPTLDYRQHASNATGANRGMRQTLVRARRLASGEYRRQCAEVASFTASIAASPLRQRLGRIAPLFERSTFATRAALSQLAPELRREPRERALLRLALRLGAW